MVYTKQTALAAMRKAARSIVDPLWANELLVPFGRTIEDLEITPKPTKIFGRVMTGGPEADMLSVAVESVAIEMAVKTLAFKEEETRKAINDRAPSNGRGQRAEDRVNAAVDLLEQHFFGYTEKRIVLAAGQTHWCPGTTKREFVGPGEVVIRDHTDGSVGIVEAGTTAKTRPIPGKSL